jgi:hypothetical protein
MSVAQAGRGVAVQWGVARGRGRVGGFQHAPQFGDLLLEVDNLRRPQGARQQHVGGADGVPVVADFAFRDGELTEEKVADVLKALPGVLPAEKK